ncbi:MAG TPA: hypothetical protein VGM23_09640, partial [Armatimonadota bacterium]
GHQWALATSRDLVHWQQHGLVLPIDNAWECSICTGSVFHHAGVFHAFYATRKAGWDEHLSHAVSPDGIHFTKCAPNPFRSPGPGLTGDYRDPLVFREEATGRFHMLVSTAQAAPALAGRGGLLEHLVSTDLYQWDVTEPFFQPDLIGVPECVDYFHWNGWYYLLFSACGGMARYRMSRDPLGPWQRPALETLNGPMARVMKTAPFTGNRRLGVSFLPCLADPANIDSDVYAGHTVFQELLQREDGTLDSCFPLEMLPAHGPAWAWSCTAVTPEVTVQPAGITVRSPGLAVAALPGAPRNAVIHLRIDPLPGTRAYGLCVRGSGNYARGLEIRLRPGTATVEVRDPQSGLDGVNVRHAIAQVDGLDGPLTLDIVLTGDILDVNINRRRCLVNRCPTLDGDTLFLYCESGSVTFTEIAVREIHQADDACIP